MVARIKEKYRKWNKGKKWHGRQKTNEKMEMEEIIVSIEMKKYMKTGRNREGRGRNSQRKGKIKSERIRFEHEFDEEARRDR